MTSLYKSACCSPELGLWRRSGSVFYESVKNPLLATITYIPRLFWSWTVEWMNLFMINSCECVAGRFTHHCQFVYLHLLGCLWGIYCPIWRSFHLQYNLSCNDIVEMTHKPSWTSTYIGGTSIILWTTHISLATPQSCSRGPRYCLLNRMNCTEEM